MPTQMVFITMMILGVVITTSSSSWFSAWMGLEINMLSFIPILANQKNKMHNEAMLKYFLTQAIASAILLIPIVTTMGTMMTWNQEAQTIIIMALIMKMGAAPFHFWLPQVMEGLSWTTNMILATIQKIPPIFLLTMSSPKLLPSLAALSMLLGSIGGYNQTSLRKIMAYSSISHMGGMMLAMNVSNSVTAMYLTVYIILSLTMMMIFYKMNISTTSQYSQSTAMNHTLMMINMLSLGGLPPFLGFVPKWVIINTTLTNNVIMPMIMIMTSLITLFFYMRLTYAAFLLSSPHSTTTTKTTNTMLILSTSSLWALPIMLLFI